jgi:hypothetical protein
MAVSEARLVLYRPKFMKNKEKVLNLSIDSRLGRALGGDRG